MKLDSKLLSTEEHLFIEDMLAEANQGRAFALVLLGSVARGKRTRMWSDLDLLAVEGPSRQAPPTVHFIQLDRSALLERVARRDDFAQWALRYGEPIFGADRWRKFSASALASAPWPDPVRKFQQATDRLSVASALSEVGDYTSAQKEAIYAASHTARAILLSVGRFPLSRPELPTQLRHVGQPRAAEILERLTDAAMVEQSQFRADLSWLREAILSGLSGLTTSGAPSLETA